MSLGSSGEQRSASVDSMADGECFVIIDLTFNSRNVDFEVHFVLF